MLRPYNTVNFKFMGFFDFLFGKKKKTDQTEEQAAPAEETPTPDVSAPEETPTPTEETPTEERPQQ
ncbi:unnamed protein product [marine sediment metagenome]|uniref:Uncharacterized protein n=1 Tax=marine sediment metagenome TaxID=412755 RepID=X0XSM3_9ZZZZ